MSEAKFFPLKKFLIVNRGDEIPENVTVLCDGGRELVIKHANSFEARRELQYRAKLLGANALLNVHVDRNLYAANLSFQRGDKAYPF